MPTFEHPANGHRETIGFGSLVLTALFGPLYLALQGAWAAAFLDLLLAPLLVVVGAVSGLLVGGLAGLIVFYLATQLFLAWTLQPLIGRVYLRRGWRQI